MKVKSHLRISVILGAIWGAMMSAAWADAGRAVVPLEPSNVRLVDEHTVFLGQLKDGQLDAWQVISKLRLQNESDQAIDLQMGLPYSAPQELCREGEEDCNLVDQTSPFGPKKSDRSIEGLEVMRQDRPILITQKKLEAEQLSAPLKRFTHAYGWHVAFKPGETLDLDVRYRIAVADDDLGHRFAHHIITPNRSWKGGRIERSVIEIQPNIAFKLCQEIREVPEQWMTLPEQFQLKGEGKARRLIFENQAFTPNENIQACFYTRKDFIELLKGHPQFKPDFESLSLKDLRLARNQLFAYFGFVFTSPDLKAYFENQWWYEPDARFDPDKLPDDLKREVQWIKELEQQKAKSK